MTSIAFARLWAGPAAVAWFVTGGPLFVAAVLSFWGEEANRISFVGLQAYLRLMQAPEWSSFLRIVRRAAVVAMVCQFLAAPVAFFIQTRRRGSLRLVLTVGILAPFLTSDAMRAFAWSTLLGPSGTLAQCLDRVTFGALSGGVRFTEAALVTGLASSILPFGVLATLMALPRPDDTAWKVSAALGAASWTTFIRLALPAALPGMCVGWMYMTTLATFASVEEQFIGEDVSMAEISAALLNADVGDTSRRFLALSGMIGLTLSAMLALGLVVVARHRQLSWVASRFTMITERLLARSVRWAPGLRSLFDPFVCAVTFLAYSVVLLPVLQAVSLSFASTRSGGWTLDHFVGLSSSRTLLAAVRHSVFVALGVGAACSVLASLLATVRWQGKTPQLAVVAAVSGGAIVPADCYAIGLLQAAKALGVEQSGFWLVTIGHVAWALPFCFGGVLLSYQFVETKLLLAAAEYGLGPVDLWRRIITRVTRPAILASFVFGFLLSLNDSRRGSYLGGGEEFLSTRVYGRLQAGLVEGRQVFACATAMLVVSIMLAGAALVVAHRRETWLHNRH